MLSVWQNLRKIKPFEINLSPKKIDRDDLRCHIFWLSSCFELNYFLLKYIELHLLINILITLYTSHALWKFGDLMFINKKDIGFQVWLVGLSEVVLDTISWRKKGFSLNFESLFRAGLAWQWWITCMFLMHSYSSSYSVIFALIGQHLRKIQPFGMSLSRQNRPWRPQAEISWGFLIFWTQIFFLLYFKL